MASDLVRGQVPGDWSCGIGDEPEGDSSIMAGILPTSKKAKAIMAGIALAGIGLYAWSHIHPSSPKKTPVSNPAIYLPPTYKSPSGRIMMSPQRAEYEIALARARRAA